MMWEKISRQQEVIQDMGADSAADIVDPQLQSHLDTLAVQKKKSDELLPFVNAWDSAFHPEEGRAPKLLATMRRAMDAGIDLPTSLVQKTALLRNIEASVEADDVDTVRKILFDLLPEGDILTFGLIDEDNRENAQLSLVISTLQIWGSEHRARDGGARLLELLKGLDKHEAILDVKATHFEISHV